MAEFENLLVALNVTEKRRQRALLLYYAGKDVHEIYRSLLDTDNDEFDEAKAKLTEYFEPKVNVTYEVFHFRQLKQEVSDGKDSVGEDEHIDAFVTRLRKKAKRCGFTTNSETEIKYQLVVGC